MKKLIKLSEVHYIIVDDSEPKAGDFVYGGLNGNDIKQYGKYFADDWQKITHSTQPLGFLQEEGITTANLKHDWANVKKLSLQECEELTQGYSVDSICEKEFHIKYPSDETIRKKALWKDGFNTHKELVGDKLFTIEDIRKGCALYRSGKTIDTIIQQLLPKTEWDIEIDEHDKMKLI